MAKKKPTNKDRDYALSAHEQAIRTHTQQINEMFNLFINYLDYKGDTENLTNFIVEKAKDKVDDSKPVASDT